MDYSLQNNIVICLIDYRFEFGPTFSKMAATANWLYQHKNVDNSVTFTDMQLDISLAVAETHPKQSLRVQKDHTKTLVQTSSWWSQPCLSAKYLPKNWTSFNETLIFIIGFMSTAVSFHLFRPFLQGSQLWTRLAKQFPSLQHHETTVYDPQQEAAGVPLTTFLDLIEELFSAWRWKV